MVSLLIGVGAGCAPAPVAGATSPEAVLAWPDNPEELGRVRWRRGFDGALAEAARSDRPVLVLFDEIPGCSTVKAYGRGTLSDPLVVDAIEANFVPVVVQNNVDGPDRAVLERYGEPAWNNPVVRIVDEGGSDLVPRLTGDWSPAALLSTMVAGLRAASAEVPAWLELVAWEASAPAEVATYRTGCFWSGEAHLGSDRGVLSTATGFIGGAEVVQVRFDPGRTPRDRLDAHAAAGGYPPVGSGTIRPTPLDDRHALRGTVWGAVPLTAAQASRVNAAVAAGSDPTAWLSPRQVAIGREAAALGAGWHAGLGQIPITEGFDRAMAAIARR